MPPSKRLSCILRMREHFRAARDAAFYLCVPDLGRRSSRVVSGKPLIDPSVRGDTAENRNVLILIPIQEARGSTTEVFSPARERCGVLVS